ncbi:MAG: Pls/PosA family non-ribosomal peptide synthetase [Acidimicrobiales bacterium]
MTIVADDLTVKLSVADPAHWALKRHEGHALLVGDCPDGTQRLDRLFEERCDQLRRTRQAHRLAVQTEEESLTYRQLDELANRTARYLAARGVRAGDRIGLLVDRSVWAYASMLAVMKVGATYVPLDKQFPLDRIEYMVDDAKITSILAVSAYAGPLLTIGIQVIVLDEARPRIELERGDRLRQPFGSPDNDLCYIIYTSGTTGRPKGVPITHANVANFVEVARDIYGLTPDDRMYQGLTLAFDFAVEEIWVPLASGATLVPAPNGVTLLGPDLSDFLRAERITALCCVPTLLATVEPDLPDLTFLLVSGEACPDELANRWHHENRRFLNVYGPTEATVSATWTELTTDGRVTIGGPLPTYTIVILAVDEPRSLARGEVGEIGIAGPGLAPGYLNRDDKTAAAFVDDFIGIPNNPSGRIYRTGDLGRFNDRNEIEYLGRIDTQVKVRGYRIELDEISSALMEVASVGQAVVIDHTTAAGVTELAAYYTRRTGAPSVETGELDSWLRERLPPYMVPSSYMELDELPMLPSHKVDRNQLPAPGSRRPVAATADGAGPADELEEQLASVTARVLGLAAVPVDADWFDELGASSLLLVHVCNELRTDPRLAQVSVRDLYEHRTVAALARHLRASGLVLGGEDGAADVAIVARPAPHRATPRQHLLCGALQTAWMLLGLVVVSSVLVVAFAWIVTAPDATSALARSAIAGPAGFVAATALSVAAKWVLVGRWRQQRIPVWSLGYFRYWAAKNAVRANPMRVFAGSPLYNVYLRLLGVRIGRGVTILSTVPPVCTDLITIGDGAIIRPDTVFNGCRLEDGYVETGPVTVGARAHVGEASVLDIDTEIADHGTLGHRSSLHQGQRVPEFRTMHGTPAELTTTDYRVVPSTGRGAAARRAAYSLWRLSTLVVGLILGGFLAWWLLRVAETHGLAAHDHLPYRGLVGELIGWAVLSTIAFIGALLVGLVVMAIVPRLLSPLVKPGVVYPLYGVRYGVARVIGRVSNSAFYNSVFGDSSLVLGYLSLIGYRMRDQIQTGSNFGSEQRQGNPLRCTVGRGTLVSDGLTMMNLDYSATSFTSSPVTLPAQSFLGNNIHLPAQARLGDDCLLATKVLVPIDRDVPSGTGLLGSPPFEIPRSSPTEIANPAYHDPAVRSQRLSLKLRDNLFTLAGFLLGKAVVFTAALTPTAALGLRLETLPLIDQILAALAIGVGTGVLSVAIGVGATWLALGFRRLDGQKRSIYDPYYWYHERYWKWADLLPRSGLNGTPWRPLVLRLMGVRVGRRVVDEGCGFSEHTLTTIGDDTCLNEKTTIQGHSQEDGMFKSDHMVLGRACTVGVGAFVHYGTRLGDRSVLRADAFLLKGEAVPPGAVWEGNPARAARPLPSWPAPDPAACRVG